MAKSHNGSYVGWGKCHIQLAKASLMQPMVCGSRKYTPVTRSFCKVLGNGQGCILLFLKGRVINRENNTSTPLFLCKILYK